MYRSPLEIVRNSALVSSAPLVYSKVKDIIEDPRSSLADLADIISGDAALSARLLKIANSSLFGFPEKVETITHALSILGTEQLLDLILATSVLNRFKNIGSDLITVESFWKHSIACGIAAKTIAVYRREINAERFYVLGLLHDIGRLIIFENAPDIIRAAVEQQEQRQLPLYQIEKEMLGYDHAAVGGALMKTWKLPASMEETVAFHHNPLEAAQYPVETAIIHVADIIATAMKLGSSREYFVPPLELEAWKLLELPLSQLSFIWDQVDRQFIDTVGTFLFD